MNDPEPIERVFREEYARIVASLVRRFGDIDRLHRENRRDDKHRQAVMEAERRGVPEPAPATGPVADDRLRLVFTCCHPSLAPEARVALTLRLVAGLTVPEIAGAFLCPRPRWPND